MGLFGTSAATAITPTLATAERPRRRTTYRQPPKGSVCRPRHTNARRRIRTVPMAPTIASCTVRICWFLIRYQHEEGDQQDEDEVREGLFAEDPDPGALVSRELVEVDGDADEQQPDQRGGR